MLKQTYRCPSCGTFEGEKDSCSNCGWNMLNENDEKVTIEDTYITIDYGDLKEDVKIAQDLCKKHDWTMLTAKQKERKVEKNIIDYQELEAKMLEDPKSDIYTEVLLANYLKGISTFINAFEASSLKCKHRSLGGHCKKNFENSNYRGNITCYWNLCPLK